METRKNKRRSGKSKFHIAGLILFKINYLKNDCHSKMIPSDRDFFVGVLYADE